MRIKSHGKTEAPPVGNGVTIQECPRKKGKFRVINEGGEILDARPLERDHAINLAWNRVYRAAQEQVPDPNPVEEVPVNNQDQFEEVEA